MNNDMISTDKNNKGKAAAGILLLIVGALLLVKQFHFFFIPTWLISWPMVVIGWGIYLGATHDFKKPSWFFVTLLGIALLINENINNASHVVWPVGLIILGLWAIFKPAKYKDKYFWENKTGANSNLSDFR